MASVLARAAVGPLRIAAAGLKLLDADDTRAALAGGATAFTVVWLEASAAHWQIGYCVG